MLLILIFVPSLFLDTPIRDLEKEFKILKTVLQENAAHEKNGAEIKQRGWKGVFTPDEELELKNCIVTLARLEFAPTLSDIREIVADYVNIDEKEKAQKTFHYKKLKGSPGKDWITLFMKRQNLSLKNATKLSKPCQNATKNPFIINHWFDILEESIENLGLKECPDLIWNVDESGVPHEPKKCKVVSLKGQPTLKIITGLDRDNKTILVAVSGSGETLPLLIVFQRKQIQTTWRPSTKPDYKFYPWIYANEKGWMNSNIFYKWFVEWEKRHVPIHPMKCLKEG